MYTLLAGRGPRAHASQVEPTSARSNAPLVMSFPLRRPPNLTAFRWRLSIDSLTGASGTRCAPAAHSLQWPARAPNNGPPLQHNTNCRRRPVAVAAPATVGCAPSRTCQREHRAQWARRFRCTRSLRHNNGRDAPSGQHRPMSGLADTCLHGQYDFEFRAAGSGSAVQPLSLRGCPQCVRASSCGRHERGA